MKRKENGYRELALSSLEPAMHLNGVSIIYLYCFGGKMEWG